MEVAEYFELTHDQAGGIIMEVKAAIQAWRDVAARLGIAQVELNRMGSAFGV